MIKIGFQAQCVVVVKYVLGGGDGEVLITSPALLFPSDDRRRRLPELTGDRITSVVKKKALLQGEKNRTAQKRTN